MTEHELQLRRAAETAFYAALPELGLEELHPQAYEAAMRLWTVTYGQGRLLRWRTLKAEGHWSDRRREDRFSDERTWSTIRSGRPRSCLSSTR